MSAAALTFLGVAALLWLVREAGVASLLASLLQVSSCLPYVVALEALRVLAELWSMQAVLGPHTSKVHPLTLLRAQLVCSALSIVMPAGRAVGEGAKAATLSAALPVPVAAGTGALGQMLTFIVNGATGLVGAVIVWRLGHAGIAGVCLAYGALLLSLGAALLLCVRSPVVAETLARHRLTAQWSAPFLRASRTLAVGWAGLGRALAAQALGRGLQGAQLALLAFALGHSSAWADAALLQTIYMLGAAAGDWVPAQLGTVDAAFALARPLLGMKPSAALALALAVHAVQLIGAALCFAGLLLPARAARETFPSHVSRPTGPV